MFFRSVFLKSFLIFILFVSGSRYGFSQDYISYFTGDTSNIETPVEQGLVLMGGSTENDSAMVWWLKKAGGGDILVIRASGSNGYNDYLFSELGISVNSVETIVFQNRQASYNSYVIRRLAEAEAIWIAGGDQARYVNYWKNSPVDSLLNYLVNQKKVPIGGTSAGMAILGSCYFAALNGSVSSAEALSNPYNSYVTMGCNDFLQFPFLEKTITDTHFDNPDRRGRLTTFLARLYADSLYNHFGIASEEKTAVCIDSTGKGRIFGNSPISEFAYFIKTNCEVEPGPEVCLPGQPLTWARENKAIKVYRVPGNNQGTNWFDLKNWESGQGGNWQNWYVFSGTWGGMASDSPVCLTAVNDFGPINSILGPNPASDYFSISNKAQKVFVTNLLGQKVILEISADNRLNVQSLPNGCYQISIKWENGTDQIYRLFIMH